MKDAVITVRLTSAKRRQIERLARDEGRSLSQQIERLIDRGMGSSTSSARGARSLAGVLSGGTVPSIEDFRSARREISAALGRRHGKLRH